MAERDQLDRLLDAALSTYADPDPNLSPRILAQMSAASSARTRRERWFWAAGLALAGAAAVLLIALSSWRAPAPKSIPQPQIQHQTLATAPPPPEVPTHTASPHSEYSTIALRQHAIAHHSPATPTPPAPKQETFLAPRPLTAEEETLARFVAQSSAEQREDLLARQQRSADLIHISAISIPPISSPAEGKE